jgi:predicted N-formylglutamate amidohydrolase
MNGGHAAAVHSAHGGKAYALGPRASRPIHVLVTCEHGGNHIPSRYRRWFEGEAALLASHRGYDPGALAMARTLAASTGATLIATTVSRLLVELNRSPHNPRVFSAIVRRAPPSLRRDLFEAYYQPYHHAVVQDVSGAVARGARVVHIGSHSFTPELDGVVRNADIGLLYDPARSREVMLCTRWRESLGRRALGRVRRNYPYAGAGDGLTTMLRRRFGVDDYVGVELEVNQRHPVGGGRAWRRMRREGAAALCEALCALAPGSRRAIDR